MEPKGESQRMDTRPAQRYPLNPGLTRPRRIWTWSSSLVPRSIWEVCSEFEARLDYIVNSQASLDYIARPFPRKPTNEPNKQKTQCPDPPEIFPRPHSTHTSRHGRW